MDLTKENLDNRKAKAEERIADWIVSCQNAGINRLYDQYATSSSKRMQLYKKGCEHLPKLKAADPSTLKPLKQKDKKTKKHSETGGEWNNKERVKKKKNVEGSLSRLTEDKESNIDKKYRDSASLFREMNNKSSHNKSSFRNSVCSMDAISLMCDDPNDKAIEEYYKSSRYDKDYKLSFFNMSDTTKSKKNKEKESVKKNSEKSKPHYTKLPKRFQNERSSLSTFDRAEKTFYKCDKIEKFKPRMSKFNRFKNDKKEKMKKFEIRDECISGEFDSATDLCDPDPKNIGKSHKTPLSLPLARRQVTTNAPVVEDLSCLASSQAESPETPVQSCRAQSNFSNIPITFKIDTSRITPNSDGIIRAESSAGWTAPPMIQIDIRPSKSEIYQLSPARIGASRSPLAVKKSKSKLSRINLSKTPSSILQPVKSNVLLQSASRKCLAGLAGLASSTNLANQASDKRKQRLERFRRFTKKYIIVSRLLNAVKAKMRHQTKEEIISMNKDKQAQKSNVLDFDVSYFKAATTSYGGLSQRARDALWKKVHQRTERDIYTLKEVMDRLPFFHKYPESTKSDLARILWYDRFEDKRVIIKQGDIGSRMYFVVSGGVSMKATEIDPRTGLKSVVHLKDVQPGSTFGELALIRDVKRTCTAVCKGESEFLSLSKDDFNSVLRHKWEQDWQERQQFIESLACFQGATADQIKNATDLSEIKSFADNKIILGNVESEFVYFIKKGKCEMIKNLSLLRTQSPYLRPSMFLSEMKKDTSKFMDKPYGKMMRFCRKENHLLTVMSLHPGDVFGVGEDLQDIFILTKGQVECLLINSAFYAINQMSDRLVTMKNQIEERIPSNIELYKKFEANRKWTEYKKNLVEKVKKRRTPTATRMDIPQSLLMEPTIPDDLIWSKKDL